MNHTIVIFFYDIFAETRVNLEAHDIKLHSLATWWDVLTVCKKNNYFDGKTLTEVEAFLNSPLEWSGNHGGTTEIAV